MMWSPSNNLATPVNGFVLSAAFHLLNATLLRALYLRNLERCYSPTRWIEYALSAPIMITVEFASRACHRPWSHGRADGVLLERWHASGPKVRQ